MKQKKRVAAIISEYWDISHADVIITKMLDGFSLDGYRYESTLDIVSMYVDQFPDNDMSREISRKHNVPLYGTIEEALKQGGDVFDLDGIILIGEHGNYPENEKRQLLYPRRRFFEACLNVMLEAGRVVPVYTDKGYAVIREDIEWMYAQIKQHNIPFMSSSVVPFAQQYPSSTPPPKGAPLSRMLGFSYDWVDESPERYVYHTLEMLQSIAENRAYGETGIRSVRVFEREAAIAKLFGPEWNKLYRRLAGFIDVADVEKFPYLSQKPLFIEVDYNDGLNAGILHVDSGVVDFVSAFQADEQAEPFLTEFYVQPGKPYSHFCRLVLEIEKFIHSARPPFPVERSFLTTGALDAIMTAIYEKREVATPYLQVRY